MSIERDALTGAKNRSLPIDPDGAAVVRDKDVLDVLLDLAREMKAVRLILAEAFGIEVDPEEME